MNRPDNFRRLFASISLALFTFLLVISSVSGAHAAEGPKDSIALTPTSKHYSLDAGTKKEDTIKIINDGLSAYTFTVYAEPYSVKDETYDPDFITIRENTDVESWVSFPKTSFHLEPREAVDVPYVITVPKDAAPGGHYGVIFAETQPPSNPTGGASLDRKKRLGALVYATVNGTYTMGGKFGNVSTPFFQFKAPLKTELEVENTGNSDFPVKTSYTVSNILGSKKYAVEKEYQLLPKTKRRVILTWDQSPGFGLYQVTTSAQFLDQQIVKKSYVLMAPLYYYMIFIVGLLVAVIYYVQKRR